MQKLGDYRIIKLMGRGPFGETFKAVKNGLTVALKVIKEEAGPYPNLSTYLFNNRHDLQALLT